MESWRKTLYERCIACILMNSVCASVDFVLNSIGLLWCNGSERQLRQGATKKRDNCRPAEVGDRTQDTRAKNRDVPPKAGRVATLLPVFVFFSTTASGSSDQKPPSVAQSRQHGAAACQLMSKQCHVRHSLNKRWIVSSIVTCTSETQVHHPCSIQQTGTACVQISDF